MNSVVANSQLIQKINRLKVLNFIRRNPDTPRNVIAQKTGLSVASLTNIASYLISKSLLTETGTESSCRVGRKSTLLRFNASAYGLVCISLGVGSISVSYTDLEGRITDKTSAGEDNIQPQKVIEFVREYIASLIEKYGREKILAIGISISGLVLDGSRFVVSSSLKWREFDLKAMLEKDTGLPVFVENMSLLKAVWCFSCSSSGFNNENMVFVDMENGIGSCQYYNGEINRAMLGEIGHTTVEHNGEQCFCGNRGCLEAMCSAHRIAMLYREYSGDSDCDFDYVVQQYKLGSDAAQRAVHECARYLGIGLANLVNICKPSVIVINTGQFTALPELIQFAQKELCSRAYPALLEDLVIQQISVSEQQAVCGAAFNLCDRLFDISYTCGIID